MPEDILKMLRKLFPDLPDQQETESFIQSLWQIPLNVGPEQLARAVLHLSDGNIDELRRIKNSEFFGDPRDLIMMANEKPDHRGAGEYFIEPFCEFD